MKLVQIGILICLASITVLLGAIYMQQRSPEPAAEAPPIEAQALVARSLPVVAPTVQPLAPPPQPKPRPVRASVVPVPPAEMPAEVALAAPDKMPHIEPATAPRMATPQPVLAKPPAAPIPTAPEPRTVTLPAGTPIVVRLDHTLSTERNQPGDDFQSTLDEPLVVVGLVIAEKGAQVNGRVISADRAGRVKGRAYLALELMTLETQDGQLLAIATQASEQEAAGTQKKDATRVGIGAGIGAALGAIIGGGKGAAIGAATGAGAGAGTVAATRGEPVVLRPETRLEFELSQPVTVTEQLY